MTGMRFSRKRVQREKNKVVLIVCEGKTEEEYLGHFKSRNLRIHIKSTKERDPVNLVKQLKNYVKEEGASIKSGDSVWVVFDMEDKEDNKKRAEKAIKMAKNNRYEIGLSIPSFELWLILHYRLWSHRASNQDLMDEIKKPDHIPTYKKGMDVFDIVHPKTEEAINNAKNLHKKHYENGLSEEEMYSDKANPITHVYKLVEFLEHYKI